MLKQIVIQVHARATIGKEQTCGLLKQKYKYKH